MDNSGPGPARPAEVPAEPAAQALPGQIAELVGEISDATSRNAISPTRRRRLTAAIPRLGRKRAGRGGKTPPPPAPTAITPTRPRRLTAAIPRLARRSGRATWFGVQSGGRWLTAEVLAMAPRLPVRDQQTLRAQFPGLDPEDLADALIQGSARAAGAVAAAAGAAMVLPLPAAPVEIAVEA